MTEIRKFITASWKAITAGVAAGAGAFQAGGTLQTSIAAGLATAALTWVVPNQKPV